MSDMTIPIAFKHQFRDQFHVLGQQMNSRLWATCRDDPDYLQGIFGYFDRIGVTEVVEGLPRNADTPNLDVPHSRRRLGLVDADWGKLVDKQDATRMGRGDMAMAMKYAMLAVGAMNRWKDRRIIGALGGNAVAIDENLVGTNVPLPAAQKIAAAGTGLTKDKLLAAQLKLDQAELLPEINGQARRRYLAATAKQKENLLKTTEVTSADYNTVKALVNGEIDTWIGFKFIWLELLKTDGAGARLCYAYAHGTVGIAIGEDITTDIDRRKDKRNAVQTYVNAQGDATRIEDEGVVEIACVEA